MTSHLAVLAAGDLHHSLAEVERRLAADDIDPRTRGVVASLCDGFAYRAQQAARLARYTNLAEAAS